MNERIALLNHRAYQIRKWSIIMTTQAGSGHPTSALSAADIVAALFFDVMQFDPDRYENPSNDRFILSKGHASPVLYAAWHELGKLSDADLLTYRHFNSPLEGHPTLRFPYTEAATGSLGMGLSIGAGEALAAKADKRSYRTFVLMGDSEMSEGSVWEAVQLAAFYKLNNLIGIIDCNRLGQSTATMEALEGDESARFAKMFCAFGWQTHCIDGHDMKALVEVLTQARAYEGDKPIIIIATTKKGYGVDMLEDKEGFHGKTLKDAGGQKALQELEKRFYADAHYAGQRYVHHNQKQEKHSLKTCDKKSFISPDFKSGDMIATRKAYGVALVKAGELCSQVVSLDAEVKNSTYAQTFEESFPDRFYQCFIAEQNMVGMAIGMERRGKIPFVSTFGSFFSRAADQIRMAAIGSSALRLVGSHAGVSIGEDGPSQMALEDIAFMRTLSNSVVLYPCDAVSTYKLVNEMLGYQDGISYLRTTRGETPVIYSADSTFTIGGCSVLRSSDHDAVCIIAAGITVFEALKAYEELKKSRIHCSIIDLYSIKPLDLKTVLAAAQASGNRVITVEDHYKAGGIGEAIASALSSYAIPVYSLAVSHMPRSGKPHELMRDQAIDAYAIMELVKKVKKFD